MSSHEGSEDDRRADLRLPEMSISTIRPREDSSFLLQKKSRTPPLTGSEVIDSDGVESDTTQSTTQLRRLSITPVQRLPQTPQATGTVLSSQRRSTRQRKVIQRGEMVSTVEALDDLKELLDEVQITSVRPKRKADELLGTPKIQTGIQLWYGVRKTIRKGPENRTERGQGYPGYDEQAALRRAYERLLVMDPEWVKARS